jgi:hypothetical protein
MRKVLEQIPTIFPIFMVIMLVFTAICAAFNYVLIVYNQKTWFILNSLIELVLTVLYIVNIIKKNKASNLLFLPLLSVIYLLLLSQIIDDVSRAYLSIHAVICFVCCLIVSFFHRGNYMAKAILGILNSLLLFAVLGVAFLGIIFGGFGSTTVIDEVVSQKGYHSAILINFDQGALGGSTIVNIEYNRTKINVLIGKMVVRKTLYTAEWGEFETMTLNWWDENTLLINGRPYRI